jgi:pimeloyl-ACP methyl ester carboxylesterase
MYPAGEAAISVRYVPLSAGIRLRVLESGPPSGDAVLMLHGWGSSVYSFDAMIPALATAGYRAVAFDLPGHGLSDKPTDPRLYSTDALADLVRELLGTLGLQRVALVGHSMGAAIALRMAAQGDARVGKLVLLNPAGLGSVPAIFTLMPLTPGLVDRFAPPLVTRALIGIILRIAYATRGRPTERDIDEYWAPSQFDEYIQVARACIHAFTWRRVRATALRAVRLPVLVIDGKRDFIVRGAARRARLIPSARIVSIPGCGHIALQECSDRTNAEVLSFLASTPTHVAPNAYHD